VAGALLGTRRITQMSKSPSSLSRLEEKATRVPSGDTRGCISLSCDSVSRNGMGTSKPGSTA
jgi:hypothetical protein